MKFLAAEYLYPSSLLSLWGKLLGLYVLVFSFLLLPFAVRLYSNAGFISDPTLTGAPHWATLAYLSDAPSAAVLYLVVLVALGGLLAFGLEHPLIPFFAWALYSMLQNRNPLTAHPGTDIIGYLLALTAIIFFYKKYLGLKERGYVALPRILYEGVWIMLGVCFSASGIARLRGESWADGSGIASMLALMPPRADMVSNTLRTFLIDLPRPLGAALTYAVVMVFIFALPLTFSKETRRYLLAFLWVSYFIVFVVADMNQILFAVFLLFLFLTDILLAHAAPEASKRVRALWGHIYYPVFHWVSRRKKF